MKTIATVGTFTIHRDIDHYKVTECFAKRDMLLCRGKHEWMTPLLRNPGADPMEVAEFSTEAAAREAIQKILESRGKRTG